MTTSNSAQRHIDACRPIVEPARTQYWSSPSPFQWHVLALAAFRSVFCIPLSKRGLETSLPNAIGAAIASHPNFVPPPCIHVQTSSWSECLFGRTRIVGIRNCQLASQYQMGRQARVLVRRVMGIAAVVGQSNPLFNANLVHRRASRSICPCENVVIESP